MSANQQMSEAWNGGESVHYVEEADRYDRQLAPFADALIERVGLEAHHAVLDIGCGCGVTTLAAARHVRAATGLDISTPLVQVATARARATDVDNADFVIADAQTFPFDAGAFDIVISEFGLMFFDDPVRAFANLRRALVPGGRIAFVSWQGLEANDWVMTVGEVVRRYVPLPQLGGLAGGPGMFALQDPDEVRSLVEAAGFVDVEVEPVTPNIVIGGGGTLDESTDFLLGMGIVRGLLSRVDDADRDAAVDAVRGSLASRYEPAVGLRLGAAGWLVSARAEQSPSAG
jgi:ubiquinone/menaquinone biosynthesis C-methylase UbiE